MTIQTVTDSLISHLDYLTGSKGKGLAVTSKGGFFLLMFGEMTGGEYDRAQLDDRIGEAYYIRLRTGIVNENRQDGLRRGACSTANQAQAQCRLVAMSHCHSIAALANLFRSAINRYRKNTIEDEDVRATANVRSTQYDFATIVIDEIPEDERDGVTGWEGGMTIISIDFDLNFTMEACPVLLPDCAEC
jgi:hypothetical protein